MFSYRSILKTSWQNTWHNKYLWFFGLFAVAVNISEFELLFYKWSNSAENLYSWLLSIFTAMQGGGNLFANIGSTMLNSPASMINICLAALIFLAIILFYIWLVTISVGALVSGSAKNISGKKPLFREATQDGIAKFWPVFSVNVLLKLIIFIFSILLGSAVFAKLFGGAGAYSSFVYILLFFLIVPVVIVISFIFKYAICYIVIKGESISSALRQSGRLFMRNWLVSLEMACILFAVSFLATALYGILFLNINTLSIFLSGVFLKFAPIFSFWLLFIITPFSLSLLAAFTGAVVTTFTISAWTGLFIDLVGQGGVSKLVRLTENKTANKK